LRVFEKKRKKEKKPENEKRKKRNLPPPSLAYPAPDPHAFAVAHGRRRRAVDPELGVRALARLELLRRHRDRAAVARVEDGGAVDGPDEELAVFAV